MSLIGTPVSRFIAKECSNADYWNSSKRNSLLNLSNSKSVHFNECFQKASPHCLKQSFIKISRFFHSLHKVILDGWKESVFMIEMSPIEIEGRTFLCITVRLPKTNLLVVTGDKGYIMCGALDVALLNEKLKSRKVIAGRAVGVKTIEELLEAPLESVTFEAESLGAIKGMVGKEALLLMN
jgi:uncharacterized protein YunC (DUF1805 family)